MKRSLSELELLLLLALVRLGPDAYGVSIARTIEQAGARAVALGSIYGALERLEEAGLVASRLGEATAERDGRAKRYFELTAPGWERLRATQEIIVNLLEGTKRVA